MTSWDLTPRVIEGENVRLEALSNGHHVEICECLLGDLDGWFSRMFGVSTPDTIGKMIEGWVKANQERKSLSFVSRDKVSGKVAGLSHFMRIDERNRQFEIGATQVGRMFRRTHVNTENKFLMLRDAFERLGAIRVYFKVDSENLISQNGVIRIGAQLEGELRNDCLLADGRRRNYKVYSLIDSEWPKVKRHIQALMGKYN